MLSKTQQPGRPRQKQVTGIALFSVILLIETLLFVWLTVTRRCGIHDTFQHFNNLYYFLNNACLYGEVPQWIPFIMQGIPAAHIYCLQDGAGLLFQVLYHTDGLVRNLNALTLFYADILVNEILLLVGTWLWAKRTFASLSTVFFVSVGVIGSAVWYSQIYFNFAFFTAVPLIIYLLHCFFDTKQWRYLCAAFNLWVIHSLTVHAYFIPVTSFIIFVYFLFSALFNFEKYKSAVQSLRWRGWPFWGCLSGIALSAALFSVLLIAKDPAVISFTPGRSSEGAVILPVFLSHGGATQAEKWTELFLRQSWLWDLTLYAGLLTACLALCALALYRKKKMLPFLFTTITLAAFTMATPLSKAVYYFWPLMKYFRHIGLISSVIRIFLCFLAGFGFEAVFLNPLPGKKSRFLLAGLSGGLLTLACFYLWAAQETSRMTAVRAFILDRQLRLPPELVAGQFTAAAGFLVLLALFWLAFMLLRDKIPARVFIVTVLCFHLIDLYGYKISQAFMRTVRLTGQQYQETFFHPVPFLKRRASTDVSGREKAFRPFLTASGGAVYCNVNAFLFIDEMGSSFVAHIWLKALDEYFRVYGGQPLGPARTLPPGYKNRRITFPSHHPGALKISGVDEDKIQFFSNAYASRDVSTAAHITDENYAGDLLFITPSPLPQDARSGQTQKERQPTVTLSGNQRLRLPYTVRAFNANHLQLTVDTRGHENAWLFYADVWHPQWKATVNGKSVPVLRANLAYKAVPLITGVNNVQFNFYSPGLAFLQGLIGICSLGWIGAVGWLLKRL